jgi:hypothetical protein
MSLLRSRWQSLCALGMVVCLTGTLLRAQDAPALPAQNNSVQSGATPTLHVYTDLVQIPVLVLDSWREKLSSPIAPNRFSISFNGGPWSRLRHVHREGNDPIDLSIVLDT